MQLTYNNLVDLKSKARDASLDWKKYDNNSDRIKAMTRYIDFFNDFRDEALDREIDMLTMDDFIVSYDTLRELTMMEFSE
jgi:hypothetical protein